MEASQTAQTEIKRHIDLLDDFFTGWNEHDSERVLACCTDDTVWTVSSMPTLKGKAEARAYLDMMFTAFPDLHFDYTLHTSLDGSRAASEWRLTGTMEGPWVPPGFAATHKPVDMNGACVYEFADGLISGHAIVFDALEFSRQVRALPRNDRIAVLLQRLMVRLPGSG